MSAAVRRVLMTADTVGGVWTYALELARGYARHGIQTILATMGRPLSAEQRRAAFQIPELQIHQSEYQLEWMDDPWDDVARAGDWLLELEGRTLPDVVHLNGYAHAVLPWQAPTVVVAHSCVYSWWEAVHSQVPPERYAKYHASVSAGLDAATRVVAPTHAMFSALTRHYGPVSNGCVIHNGITRSLCERPQKRPLVLAAGRLWDEAKNLAPLADVAPRLQWPIYLAGENVHPAGHAVNFSSVTQLGLLSADEMQGWYGRASIYALPAKYEPFGLSVLEAALHGCALVLGDIPSLRETWGSAAVFVRPDDRRELADAVNALAEDGWLRANMAQRAHVRARRYTPDAMVASYLALYQELCSDSGMSRSEETSNHIVAFGRA